MLELIKRGERALLADIDAQSVKIDSAAIYAYNSVSLIRIDNCLAPQGEAFRRGLKC